MLTYEVKTTCSAKEMNELLAEMVGKGWQLVRDVRVAFNSSGTIGHLIATFSRPSEKAQEEIHPLAQDGGH